MKKIKFITLLFVTCLLAACGSSSNSLPLLEFMDPETGMVQHRSPFPKGWSYNQTPNDPLLLTGPKGTEVYQTSSGRFGFANDPFTRQSLQMSGTTVAPLIPLNVFLEQRFAPYMQQKGFTLITSYPMPKVQAVLDLFAAGMPQGVSQKTFHAMGAEWAHADGTKAFTVLLQSILQQPKFISWDVGANELYASAEEFEAARDAFVYGVVHREVNPEWQIAKNNQLIAQLQANRQMWDERTRQSRIQHLGRMNAILARGQSSASTAKINSDILDISHAGYLKRDSMVSAGQTDTVNMIGEHAVIHNPNTGERYKVDAGANHYWVNADGKYFNTENALYNPQTDPSINDQQWTRFERVR